MKKKNKEKKKEIYIELILWFVDCGYASVCYFIHLYAFGSTKNTAKYEELSTI